MGLAAPINRATGELEADGILPGWHGIRPAAEMEAGSGCPVQLENDANVGALGEKAFGAARGVDDLIYIRLSAGIGAGLILDGRPYQGVRGVAGEVGHVLSDPSGPICRCGNRGCLESIASPVAVAGLLERSIGEPVSVKRLLELVAAGHRGARRAVAEAGEAVGRALSMLVNVLNPELVIVGGDLAQTGPVLLDPIRAAIERHSVSPAAACRRGHGRDARRARRGARRGGADPGAVATRAGAAARLVTPAPRVCDPPRGRSDELRSRAGLAPRR